MNHTPGPWTCEDDCRLMTGGGKYLVADNNFRWVAEVPVPLHSTPWTKETAIANAQFIAAAPTMLAALEDILSLFEYYEIDCEAEQAEKIIRAREALAKAKGTK